MSQYECKKIFICVCLFICVYNFDISMHLAINFALISLEFSTLFHRQTLRRHSSLERNGGEGDAFH